MLYVVCKTPLIKDVIEELASNCSMNPLKKTPKPFIVAPNTQNVAVAPSTENSLS